MEQNKFVKLSSLVGGGFTVDKYNGYSFKKWDTEQNKMLTAQSYVDGYKKSYSFDTDKGQLDLSSAQLGQALEGVFKDGTSTIVGRTFAVKSNGKTGMEIRYYINPAQREVEQPRMTAVPDTVVDPDDDIGF